MRVPSVSPEAFAAPGRALAETATRVGQAANQALQLKAQEDNADRVLKALEFGRELQKDGIAFAETFQERQDYENFEKDAAQHLEEVKARYDTRIGGDKQLQIAFERKYNQYSSNIRNVANAKKLTVMTNRALGAFTETFNEQLENYAGEPDENMREAIRADIEIQASSLVASGFMTQVQAETKIAEFNNNAEQVRADKMIELDPGGAVLALKDKEFDMSPKLVQQKIEKAIERKRQQDTAERLAQEAAERRAEKERKEAHDREENTIGNFFLTGEYEAVIPALMETQHITGDEKRTWSDAAKAKIKALDKDVDKQSQSEAIVAINSMIMQEEDPRKIRNFILTNPNLTPENQEQYLNKVETAVGSEISEGRKSGYIAINSMVDPTSDPISGIFKTSLDAAVAATVQSELDDWIDSQIKKEVPLTTQLIRRKAIEISTNRIPSIVAKIDLLEKKAKQVQRELEAREKK